MSSIYKTAAKITLEGAKTIATAAHQEAEQHNLPGAIAIVDSCGAIVYVETWDGSMPAAATIAISKALTAVNFNRPTIKLEEVIVQGRTPMLSTGVYQYAPLKGGYPIEVDGMVIGALAISGALTAENDEIIAVAALKVVGR